MPKSLRVPVADPRSVLSRLAILVSSSFVCASLPSLGAAQNAELVAVFDEHWEHLRDHYPYFDLYRVDWEAEREEHRPRAAAAASSSELHWEIARLLCVLPDEHVSYFPPDELLSEWSYPEIRTARVQRRTLVLDWGEHPPPTAPRTFRDDPHAYPELVTVQGEPLGCTASVLAAGPVGSPLSIRLRWPDGSEIDHELFRPRASNLPPPKKHYGDRWVACERVGSIGYVRVRTFDPSSATLGPAGKMTPILRECVEELMDTEGLILDVQGNGGGQVGASDPFLCHFLEERRSYAWGNSGGRRRRLVPRRPHYEKWVAVLVDGRTGSGGEWAARILRDAGRASVIGERTMGAEAAVQTYVATDGSKLSYGGWPMVEPDVVPFQHLGVPLDHDVPLTVESVRELGYDEALAQVRRERFAVALNELGIVDDLVLEELITIAAAADAEEPAADGGSD